MNERKKHDEYNKHTKKNKNKRQMKVNEDETKWKRMKEDGRKQESKWRGRHTEKIGTENQEKSMKEMKKVWKRWMEITKTGKMTGKKHKTLEK